MSAADILKGMREQAQKSTDGPAIKKHKINLEEWQKGIIPVNELLLDLDAMVTEEDEDLGVETSLEPTELHAKYHDFFFRELSTWFQGPLGHAVEKMIKTKWSEQQSKITKVDKDVKMTKKVDDLSSKMKYEFKLDDTKSTQENTLALDTLIRIETARIIMNKCAQERETTITPVQKKEREAHHLCKPDKKTSSTVLEHWRKIIQWEQTRDELIKRQIQENYDKEAHQVALHRRAMLSIQDRIKEAQMKQKTSLTEQEKSSISASALEEEEEHAKQRRCQCRYICICELNWMEQDQ